MYMCCRTSWPQMRTASADSMEARNSSPSPVPMMTPKLEKHLENFLRISGKQGLFLTLTTTSPPPFFTFFSDPNQPGVSCVFEFNEICQWYDTWVRWAVGRTDTNSAGRDLVLLYAAWIIALSSQEEAVEGNEASSNEWAERNKSQSRSGRAELVYSAISIKEIGLH